MNFEIDCVCCSWKFICCLTWIHNATKSSNTIETCMFQSSVLNAVCSPFATSIFQRLALFESMLFRRVNSIACLEKLVSTGSFSINVLLYFKFSVKPYSVILILKSNFGFFVCFVLFLDSSFFHFSLKNFTEFYDFSSQ